MKKRFFVTLLTVLVAFATVGHAENWKITTFNNLEYVNARDFCKRYDFNYMLGADVKSPSIFKNPNIEVSLKQDSRDVKINGIRHWLCFPFLRIETNSGTENYISVADIEQTFNPLFFSRMILNTKRVKGVILDPGHGGEDQGAIARSGLTEKYCALDTAMRLKSLLEAQGIPVIMTRKTDRFVDLKDRAAIANRNPDYIFVSVHYNEGPRTANGIETYALAPEEVPATNDGNRRVIKEFPGNRSNVLSYILASYVHREIYAQSENKDNDRGVKRSRFVVLRETKNPSILVEGGFISSSQDGVPSQKYRQKLAESVSKGITEYMANMNQPANGSGINLANYKSFPTPEAMQDVALLSAVKAPESVTDLPVISTDASALSNNAGAGPTQMP